MCGTIIFSNLEELATFLKAFIGSTALFKAEREFNHDSWILTFTGGY